VKLSSELSSKAALGRFDIDVANYQDMITALQIVSIPLLTIEASGSPWVNTREEVMEKIGQSASQKQAHPPFPPPGRASVQPLLSELGRD